MQDNSGSRANGEPPANRHPTTQNTQPALAILCPTQGLGSGSERVLILLLRHLGPLMADRFLVLCPEGSATHEAASEIGCRILPWRANRDSFAQNLRAFLIARRDLPPEIRLIHAWTARAFEWAVLLAQGRGAVAMGTLHDHPHAPFHRLGRRMLIRRCAAGLRPVVCVSAALQDACADLRWGCARRVIRNGLPSAPPVASRAGGPIRIGFTGLNAAWKGFETIAAWATRESAGPLEWHLFGDPAPQIARSLGTLLETAGARVVAHGRVPPDTIFHHVDVLAHPSASFDPLPTALIEAARAGIPAVASDIGGTREIVLDGETGFLFPPSNPDRGIERLGSLISNPALRRRMGAAARRRFENDFMIDRMVDSYVALWGKHLQK